MKPPMVVHTKDKKSPYYTPVGWIIINMTFDIDGPWHSYWPREWTHPPLKRRSALMEDHRIDAMFI